MGEYLSFCSFLSKNDSGSGKSGTSGGDKKGSDLKYIFKVKPMGLDLGDEGKRLGIIPNILL